MQNLPISPPSSDFPSDVLKWMKANAQSRTALKLMQCNKYFQQQPFPYFVVKAVRSRESGLRFLRLKPDPNRTGCMRWHFGENWCRLYIDSLKQKLWITEKFEFDGNDGFLRILLSKIAVFDVKKLILKYLNAVTFEMFKLFSSGNVQELTLINTKIRDKNGVDVPLEELLQCVSKLENLTM
uniref:Uncharacterized protein n=1 Tax=Panagrolaimus sp. PS1159 TaxID=55785 RepID=A0AC35G269_9BILA